ncbi:MAG: hypothetical protein IJR99_02750 [Kiritimatiellae bacterium]|nr:hypothetical protein [Kiritimatiellia bacterium]
MNRCHVWFGLFFLAIAVGTAGTRIVATDAGTDNTGKSDATSVIQRCIDTVSCKGGGTVYLPPGVYRVGSLSLGAGTRLQLAGGVKSARIGYTEEVRKSTLDPSVSAILRTSGKSTCSIFLYNLVTPAYCTNGVGDITVSGGVFDCQGKMKVLAFACGRKIRIENMIVKDIPNNHAFQIDGCENVVITNCLFAGYRMGKVLTRETIQIEQTSPYAITGNPDRWPSPILCSKKDAFINRNVCVSGCWFGPSEKSGPHLVAVGHHGRVPTCAGFSFIGNTVVDPLYCGLHLPDFTDVVISDNTFIATNRVLELAQDAAMISLYGQRPRTPGSPAVRIFGNRFVLDPEHPRKKLFVSEPRRADVSFHE